MQTARRPQDAEPGQYGRLECAAVIQEALAMAGCEAATAVFNPHYRRLLRWPTLGGGEFDDTVLQGLMT